MTASRYQRSTIATRNTSLNPTLTAAGSFGAPDGPARSTDMRGPTGAQRTHPAGNRQPDSTCVVGRMTALPIPNGRAQPGEDTGSDRHIDRYRERAVAPLAR